jgi:hypothetical protein
MGIVGWKLIAEGLISRCLDGSAKFRIQLAGGKGMSKQPAQGNTPPDGFVNNEPAEEVVNDSLGTVDPADDTGTDSEEEAKKAGKGAGRDPGDIAGGKP